MFYLKEHLLNPKIEGRVFEPKINLKSIEIPNAKKIKSNFPSGTLFDSEVSISSKNYSAISFTF